MALLFCLFADAVSAEKIKETVSHPDVSFLAIGKAANRRQHGDKQLTLLNYHFYAEIFLQPGGHVNDAYLVFPADSHVKEKFEDLGDMLKVRGHRYPTFVEMNSSYPDGDYRFIFTTSDGTTQNRKFAVRGSGADRPIPDPIVIGLVQNGQSVSADRIDPRVDVTISWTAFHQGRADANGIIDDMVFVSVTDCLGNKVDHSGKAFSEKGAFTFRNSEFVLKASLLRSGWIYPIFVEHVVADTSRENQIPGMVANAATTFLDLRTTGGTEKDGCPDVLPQMEPGQTDRPAPSFKVSFALPPEPV